MSGPNPTPIIDLTEIDLTGIEPLPARDRSPGPVRRRRVARRLFADEEEESKKFDRVAKSAVPANRREIVEQAALKDWEKEIEEFTAWVEPTTPPPESDEELGEPIVNTV